ncbi:MAG: outer membrane beta-barrel protein [Gammaproteobacteria bacterium]|nr:outer membrane beta-barrel protein [Gammaproteobacteria bacterium]
MFNKKSLAPAVLLAGTLATPLVAQAAQPGFYLGFGLGQGNDVVLDQTSAAGKFFGGFNVNRFLGLELAYVNLGSNYCCDTFGSSFTQDGVSYEIVGYLPVSPYIDLFGKVGIYNWTVSSNYYYASDSGSNNDYGFGVNARVSRNVWLRGEYQKFQDVAGGDVNMASVGFTYHFF